MTLFLYSVTPWIWQLTYLDYVAFVLVTWNSDQMMASGRRLAGVLFKRQTEDDVVSPIRDITKWALQLPCVVLLRICTRQCKRSFGLFSAIPLIKWTQPRVLYIPRIKFLFLPRSVSLSQIKKIQLGIFWQFPVEFYALTTMKTCGIVNTSFMQFMHDLTYSRDDVIKKNVINLSCKDKPGNGDTTLP